MQGLSDEELVVLSTSAGETASHRDQARDELFSRYQTRVALWCWRVAGDRDWAADLAQEVMLKAHRNLPTFRNESKFSTWLYSIARNHCFNAIQSRSVRAEEQLDFDAVADTADRGFDKKLEVQDEIKHMRELINQSLDSTEIQVMTLHYGEEMTIDSITRLLNLRNASGAKAYIVSAKRKMQTAIARWKARTAPRDTPGERINYEPLP